MLGHTLEFATALSEQYNGKYGCDNCSTFNLQVSNGVWHCDQCLYDVCTKCKPMKR